MDTNAKNVFGQPRLRASLRDLRSPRKNYKSTIEDDLKKLIIMDNLGPEQDRDTGVRVPGGKFGRGWCSPPGPQPLVSAAPVGECKSLVSQGQSQDLNQLGKAPKALSLMPFSQSPRRKCFYLALQSTATNRKSSRNNLGSYSQRQ